MSDPRSAGESTPSPASQAAHGVSGSPFSGSPFSGSIVALVTPFEESAEQGVNRDVLHKLVACHAESGTAAVVPCGTTGESPTLSHAEHDTVVEEVIAAAKGTPLKVIAGTGSNSTREAFRLTSHAAEAGADACLIVCPYYNKPSPAGLVAHFRELNRVGIPLIVYNIPGRTGINISPATLEEIAAECPNVVGLKASNGNLDEITETAKRMANRQTPYSILSGDDSLTLPILSVGGVGVISVVANFMPRVMARLVDSYVNRRDTAEAAALMQTIHELCLSLLRFGPNPAPIKSLMNRAGLNVGSCRLPLVPISDEQTDALVAQVRRVVEDLEGLGIEYDETLRQVTS